MCAKKTVLVLSYTSSESTEGPRNIRLTFRGGDGNLFETSSLCRLGNCRVEVVVYVVGGAMGVFFGAGGAVVVAE